MIDQITLRGAVEGDRTRWGDNPTELDQFTFRAEPDGTPFRRNINYRLWHVRPDQFGVCVSFYFDDNGAVVLVRRYGYSGQTANLDLDAVLRNGNVSSLPATVGGLLAPRWPRANRVPLIAGFLPGAGGEELVGLTIAELMALFNPPTYSPVVVWEVVEEAPTYPAYSPVVVWEQVEDGPTYPAYTPVVVWEAADHLPPEAPTNLRVIEPDSGRYKLEFTDNAGNEASFEIWQTTNGSAFANVGSLAASNAPIPATVASSFLSGIAFNNLYALKLRATNDAGPSAFSNTVTLDTRPTRRRIITGIQARLLTPAGGGPKRLEIQGLTRVAGTQIEFWVSNEGTPTPAEFANANGGAGGFIPHSTGVYDFDGTTLFQYFTAPDRYQDWYDFVAARPEGEADQFEWTDFYALPPNLDGNWRELLPIS